MRGGIKEASHHGSPHHTPDQPVHNMGGIGGISNTLKPGFVQDAKHTLFPQHAQVVESEGAAAAAAAAAGAGQGQRTLDTDNNAVHKSSFPGRSSDAGARHSELLHHLDHHTKTKTMKAFHQSYSAGPPPSPFWNVLKGAQTKMSDLRPNPTELAHRPLLSVVMILKNEAASIAGMIQSLVGVVDRYTIIDTGSTDRTKEIIRESFGSTPGDIYDEAFTDFATTRNRVIELEGTKSIFTLMLSGDEYLRDGMALRRFCEEHRDWDTWVNKGAKEEAYNLRILYGSDVYDSTRLHRTDARWFYVGATHEYMTNAKKRVAMKRAADAKGMIPKIFHDLSTSDPKKKKIRWSIDRDLLIEEWKKNPNRTRTAFYLAQSYECLHDYPNSFKW